MTNYVYIVGGSVDSITNAIAEFASDCQSAFQAGWLSAGAIVASLLVIAMVRSITSHKEDL